MAYYLQKIKELLKSKGLTYDWLAQAIGKSRSTVINYIMGHTKIDLETFLEIAKALDVPPEYLLNKEQESKEKGTGETQDIENMKAKIKLLEVEIDRLKSIIQEKDKQIQLQDELIKVLKERK